MIDLHCHILPGLDDGPREISVSLDMARASVADGVTTLACTPHILPGIYPNSGRRIRVAVQAFAKILDEAGIPLLLVSGADNHIVPDFVEGLSSGHLLPLADSRYVLVEPPHDVMPLGLEDIFFKLRVAGYIPILTHPERLAWIKNNYALIRRLACAGVWLQVTAGSLTGVFGRTACYWAERMLDDGIVHILATDAHSMRRRRPNLGEGRDFAQRRVGAEEAERLVLTRPGYVLANALPSDLPTSQALGLDMGRAI